MCSSLTPALPATAALFLCCFASQCGCQCSKCCYQGNPNNCTSWATGTCPYECLAHNKTNCGVQFSTPRQSIFCAIPHTSAWPAILQVGGAVRDRDSHSHAASA